MKWQPIETAPRDKSVVIMFVNADYASYWPMTGYWMGFGWFNGLTIYKPEDLTHWQPLPDPPVETDEGTAP